MAIQTPVVTVECDNCGRIVTVDRDGFTEDGDQAVTPLYAVCDLGVRLAPGETVPVGECTACGALCHVAPEPIAEGVVVKGDCYPWPFDQGRGPANGAGAYCEGDGGECDGAPAYAFGIGGGYAHVCEAHYQALPGDALGEGRA